MTLNVVTYYQISCDHPDCDRSQADDDEFTAWSDAAGAEATWEACDGVRVDAFDLTPVRHYCADHDPTAEVAR